MHRPTIIVTGGAGFIGSHTVDQLLQRGQRVVVVDDFSTGRRENLAQHQGNPSLEIVTADIAADDVSQLLSRIAAGHGGISRIIHLAAQVSVVRSVDEPIEDIRVNCAATVRLLEFARHHAVDRVVFASSAAVYGDADEFPIPEQSPTRPISPYGIDKLASEHYLRYYATVHGVPTAALRFFNVYGPRQDPNNPYTGVISVFLERAHADRPMTVFGDGLQTRDFVHVSDVASALVHVTIADDLPEHIVANVATGVETSVAELARVIKAAIGSESVIEHAPARPSEARRSVADVRCASQELGIAHRVSLADGVASTAAWFQKA